MNKVLSVYVCMYICICPHLRTCLLILDRKGKRERERNIHLLSFLCALTWDRTLNFGMCPDGESHPLPLGLWDDTQPALPHWPGQGLNFLQKKKIGSDIFKLHIYNTYAMRIDVQHNDTDSGRFSMFC